MSITAPTLTEYKANADKDSDAFLGRLVLCTVVDSTVAHATLAAELKAVGLERFTPRPPCDADVFRRVFFNGQRRKFETSDPDVSANLLVRHLDQGDGKIVKRIVAERVDRAGRRLGYTETAEIVFDSEFSAALEVKELTFDVETNALVSDLCARYHHERGHVNGNAVRETVKRVLDSALSVGVRAGVHFVREVDAHVVDAVERLGAVLPGCDIASLPLIDNGKQRDLVRKAYEEETVGELDRLTQELAELAKKDDAPSTRLLASLRGRRERLEKRLAGYSELLEDSLSATAFKLRVVEKQMNNLGKKSLGARPDFADLYADLSA